MASPFIPLHAISIRRVIASQVKTVEVGTVTTDVPPGTFIYPRT